MKILIETIPHKEQRYPTVGDWQWTTADEAGLDKQAYKHIPSQYGNEPTLVIRVSSMSDWRHEALVAVHELIEVLLCKHSSITEQQVNEFDMTYESFSGMEPGDDPKAPYHHQHRFASIVEELLAMELGVDWQTYDREVNSL